MSGKSFNRGASAKKRINFCPYLFLVIFTLASFCWQRIYSCYEDRTTCDERVFGRDSFVCVCDAEYCDVIGDVTVPSRGSYKRVISSRDKYRFRIFSGTEEDSGTGDVVINVNYDKEYQTMLGFGGAFTDSTGIAVKSLPEEAQEMFMRSYFSKEGIEYTMCRVPIAGTDFSTHPYSYDEVDNDVDLKHFSLTKEDFLYKIPFIKRAKSLSDREIRLFSSLWSPPPWMKENGKHNGKGGVLRHMWEPFTNYIIKFVEEYSKNNISLWGITTVNEPFNGFLEDFPFNACAWSAEDMRDWIKTSFGPALDRARLRDLKVMVYDSGRDQHIIPYLTTIFQDEAASQYVDGIAVHSYTDQIHSPSLLTQVHTEFGDKFLLYTESCLGFDGPVEDKVQLGSWERAQIYASNILEDVNYYSTGWVDWNMALNMEGGPNWAGNVVDAPVIVNEKEEEFYKQPMFYAMGHFSKFVKPGSKRLETHMNHQASKYIQAAAFYDESEDSIVWLILNKGEEERRVTFKTPSNKYINVNLHPKSLETILLRRTP